VSQLAGKVAKKLPKGPKSILGGFGVAPVVQKLTERVQSSFKARGRRQGYLPKGKEM